MTARSWRRPRGRLGEAMRVLAPAMMVALLVGCGGGAATGNNRAGTLTHINFGLNVPTDFDLVMPQYVARDRGFFRQEGLEVKTVSFQGGADAIKAMLAGSIDIDGATGLDAPAAVAKGAPVVEFASGGVSQSTFRLLANNRSGINSLGDLKGKKIGITRFGSLTDFVARLEGHAAGLEAGKDFTEVPVGASAAQTALLSGEIDATNANPVDAFPLLDTGKVHVVTDFSKVDPNTQFTALVATPTYLKQHAATVRAFLRAYFRAIQYLKTHRDYGIKATAAALHVDTTLATRLYDFLAHDLRTDGSMNLQGVKTYAQYLPVLGIADQVPSLDQYYTDKFVPVKIG